MNKLLLAFVSLITQIRLACDVTYIVKKLNTKYNLVIVLIGYLRDGNAAAHPIDSLRSDSWPLFLIVVSNGGVFPKLRFKGTPLTSSDILSVHWIASIVVIVRRNFFYVEGGELVIYVQNSDWSIPISFDGQFSKCLWCVKCINRMHKLLFCSLSLVITTMVHESWWGLS